MTTVTVITRPGGVADVDDTSVNVAPADWPTGDNDLSTVLAPTFTAFEAHGKYGLAWLQDPGDGTSLTGSDQVPVGASVLRQRLVVWWQHADLDYNILFTAAEGDGGSIFGWDQRGGDFPLVSTTFEVEGWELHQWCRLFATADPDNPDHPAPDDYSVPIAEWWIETDYTVDSPPIPDPTYITPGLAGDLGDTDLWFKRPSR